MPLQLLARRNWQKESETPGRARARPIGLWPANRRRVIRSSCKLCGSRHLCNSRHFPPLHDFPFSPRRVDRPTLSLLDFAFANSTFPRNHRHTSDPGTLFDSISSTRPADKARKRGTRTRRTTDDRDAIFIVTCVARAAAAHPRTGSRDFISNRDTAPRQCVKTNAFLINKIHLSPHEDCCFHTGLR